VTAGKDGIEEKRVDIGFEIAAVHLDGEFVPQYQGDGEGVVFIVIFPVPFGG